MFAKEVVGLSDVDFKDGPAVVGHGDDAQRSLNQRSLLFHQGLKAESQ